MLVLATIGQALGLALGNRAHARLLPHDAGPRCAAATASAARSSAALGVLVVVWLLIPALASSPGWPAQAVRDSAVARAIDRVAPDPPPTAETLGRLVGDQTVPRGVRHAHVTRRRDRRPTRGDPAERRAHVCARRS